MYTRAHGELAKLRTYEHELTTRYQNAVVHNDWARAKHLFGLRRRVRSAIRRREEWGS
jgi:hypothetical protein